MPSAIIDDNPKFGACTFFAKSHPGETCGSNGLPLTPNSITILGRAQRLKTIDHPNLSTYLDVIRGKHERIITVAEYTGSPLSEISLDFTFEEKLQIAHQIIRGLNHLHEQGIIHRNLSFDNILLDSNKNVLLFDYGLYYMTDEGKDVSFPIAQPKYLSPETILGGGGQASDIWNLGIVILELFLGPLWSGLKPGPVLRRIMTLLQTPNPAQRIAREHDFIEAYQDLNEDLINLIESCLKISPRERLSIKEVLNHKLFSGITEISKKRRGDRLFGCRMPLLYYWWQLAGGDIQSELRKQGLIKNSPPILSMPIAILLDGCSIGGESLALMDRRVAISGMELLISRLGHVPSIEFFPVINLAPRCNETSQLPRIIRERDTEYQFHRLILFERLLRGYPYTSLLIKKEAEIDIPPLVRGEVWSALLGIKGDIEDQYIRIDKETQTITDRQIEVDIPRCHQYCWLLSGSAGHNGLRRVLKAWLLSNPQYVYWQGLDSLSAPFLYLNFNNEARAFACLSAFVPRYLNQFFLKDNSAVIMKEYLPKFWQLTAYHEPILASHLYNIHFAPELFAIPWFLTMFSHVFPLHKILHLWDALLIGDSSLPLYMGVAILKQLRDTLLSSGFNECILLFSDLPEVDIEQCINESTLMYRTSPKSISFRKFGSDKVSTDPLDSVEIESQILKKEVCPRISCNDFLQLLHNRNVCIVDIRPLIQFNRINIEGSINIPHSGVQFSDQSISSFGPQIEKDLKASMKNKNAIVIIYSEIDTAQLFSEHLVRCKVARVCILHGGINILHTVSPPVLRSYN